MPRTFRIQPEERPMIQQSQRAFVTIAFVLSLLLGGTAQAVLVHRWTFEEPDGTASPQLKDTAVGGTRNGTFQGVMSDTNRSADVPGGQSSTRSLNFGSSNTINYVDVYGSGP